jgi:hypothetical protein
MPASTADGLHGRARPEARPPGRAGARHGERGHRAHGLPAAHHRPDDWQAAARPAAPGRPAAGRGVGLCPRAGLSQGAAPAPADAGRPAGRRGGARSGHRVFTDSAPVLEVELATRSGIGWRGKHTLALHREAGSMFFLGEIYVDLALPPTRAGERPLRHLQRLHRRLPHAGHRGAVPAGRAALHLYLTIEHAAPSRPSCAPRHRQPHLRLRRLPAGLPLEQVRAAQHAARFRCPPGRWARRPAAAVGLGRGRFLRHTEGSAIRRIGLAALAAQPGGGAGQCLAGHRRRGAGTLRPAAGAAGGRCAAGRAHRLGAGATPSTWTSCPGAAS